MNKINIILYIILYKYIVGVGVIFRFILVSFSNFKNNEKNFLGI